jgi:2-polyprenyl-3-methyl-5-hydroxy-6-metoxy-1,4-benzoquinol methylase
VTDRRLKHAVRALTPPIVWSAARRLRGPVPAGPVQPAIREVTTLQAVDAELERAEEIRVTSEDRFREALLGFRYVPAGLPTGDPLSASYHAAQLRLYSAITGLESYEPHGAEQTAFDLEAAIERPFPYAGSATVLGEQLMAIGHLIRASGVAPGMSVLEFGPGWGKTTLELAEFGAAVTAVDINEDFLRLIDERARRRGLTVHTVHSDMLDYRPQAPFDRVLFYESFHHCSDPLRLVAELDGLVAPGGAIVFAGEPIVEDFPVPWGVRLDGLSVWSMRRFGWLELGFELGWFRALLDSAGWDVSYEKSADVAWQRALVARRRS